MSMHYLSFSGGPDAVSIKSIPGHVTLNLYFCVLLELQVTVCIPVRLGHEMLTQYFSSSGWPGAVSINSVTEHVTPNLCFCFR
jgi:hypothetical protein